jgi:putative methyltransferase (TIGR04325 family)
VNAKLSDEVKRGSLADRIDLLARTAMWRVLAFFGSSRLRYRGSFADIAEAAAAVRPGTLVGYDNDAVVMHAFDMMCEINLEDYPVLFWLSRIGDEARVLLDAGGHMGTKFRAFRQHLDLAGKLEWIVYDVPSIVRAGQQRALEEGLSGIRFVDSLIELPRVDVLLASGLLQYLDIPLGDLLHQLQALPRHLLLNKVQTRAGPTVVTLENFGCAEVPYQIRNLPQFLASLDELGYDIVDQWTVPALSRTIPTHRYLGASTCWGCYARLRNEKVDAAGSNRRQIAANDMIARAANEPGND